MAIAAMILGIIGAIGGFCVRLVRLVFAIVGFVLARMELNEIERGESSPAVQQYAKIGYWCSIVGFVGFAITSFWSSATSPSR